MLKIATSPVECDLVVSISPGEQRYGVGVHGSGMGGNGGGGRVTVLNQGSGSNQGNGGGGGISTVDESITWAKMAPTTNPSASVNGESGRPGVLSIGCATTNLNASSLKGYGAGASKIEQRLDM